MSLTNKDQPARVQSSTGVKTPIHRRDLAAGSFVIWTYPNLQYQHKASPKPKDRTEWCVGAGQEKPLGVSFNEFKS